MRTFERMFEYNSASGLYPGRKTLGPQVISALKAHLSTKETRKMTKGKIQELLLDFRLSDGSRLLINQLEPVFVHLCQGGTL